MWQEVDEEIQPVLCAAVDPKTRGTEFYGPRGFQELAGGGVTEDCRWLWQLSEQLTGVSYPTN
ncbi:hypothetical protein [Mycolicibacterium sarraceniae]|uniref:Uncharacterized protein n=1 Tax=Mycolicibacterium sarraceniae TaxID=1534348 RepID=A0A7I7SX27_9MYCO|nr:hypothetical protein [Mycolicibacterium sarraceniae]BBY60366.1 hypothetical protein MSAR_35020 [Mycolicibacterium sarraceniae]